MANSCSRLKIFSQNNKNVKKQKQWRGNEYHVKREEKDIDLLPGGCSWLRSKESGNSRSQQVANWVEIDQIGKMCFQSNQHIFIYSGVQYLGWICHHDVVSSTEYWVVLSTSLRSMEWVFRRNLLNLSRESWGVENLALHVDSLHRVPENNSVERNKLPSTGFEIFRSYI